MTRPVQAGLFEEMHRRLGEPFDYGRRAAEILRHRFVYETARRLTPEPQRTLDVGCSTGRLTAQLVGLPGWLVAVDLSRTAIRKARQAAAPGRSVRFVVASATALPFTEGPFDLIVLSDGLHSWKLPFEERQAALAEAYRATHAGGYALLTEYLRPEHFDGFIGQVRASPFQVVSVQYLYDRLWYQIESWFKAVRGRPWVMRLFRSLPFALFLRSVARAFGRAGSRHICVTARKALSTGTRG